MSRALSMWRSVFLLTLMFVTACTATGGGEPDVSQGGGENEAPAAVNAEAEATSAAEPVATATAEETAPPADAPETTEPAEADDVTILTEDDRPERLRSLTQSWDTNWNRHTIPYDELLAGGPPRDGIPSIDDPHFVSPEEAAEWLPGNEPVIALELEGEARAYPLQILTWHEIANDEVGNVPVAVTFCPLCNSALTFDRRLDGEVLEFGTSGLLRHSDLVMYDRTTESLWQQFTGEAIAGDLAGKRLTFLPSALISFDDFREAHPDGQVLSRETGYTRPYGENPYAGYDTIGQRPFLFQGEVDGRLPAMARVVTVSAGDADAAYPYTALEEEGVVNDSVGDQDLVVFFKPGTSSALGARVIAEGADVGATNVFDPYVNGEKLTFVREGEKIVDEQTGSEWNMLGEAVAGELAGTALTPIVHGDHFWFSWAAFKPETVIYGSE